MCVLIKTYGYSVEDIARFITAKGQIEGIAMTHLKLQKLLYYAQGFVIACTGAKLFDEKILANQYGPYCPDIYEKLEPFSPRRIYLAKPREALIGFDAEVKGILEEVWGIFKGYSGWKLMEFTCMENPWRTAIDDGRDTEITYDMLKDFFLDFVVGEESEKTMVERIDFSDD